MNKVGNSTPHMSSVYDEQVRNTIPHYDSFHTETINIVKATGKDPRIWLDTGCGTGTFVSRAFEAFQNTMFILSDPSEEMLDIAKNKFSTDKDDRMKFQPPIPTQDIALNLNEKPDVITAI